MIGAIAGDIIGSVYEWKNVKSVEFPLFSRDSDFTDDTVLTFAVAECLMRDGDYAETLRRYARAYPGRGYGGMFQRWIAQDGLGPYNSFGNGSAMRVSPVGFAFDTESETLAEARRSAMVTHNHPDGVKGAEAVALAIYLARLRPGKDVIRKEIAKRFRYDLSRTVDSIRPHYAFDETCPGSVPEAIIAFLDSTSYEDAIRRAVSLGGDSDTIACIAGGIAQAYYRQIPETIESEVWKRLPPELAAIAKEFQRKFFPKV